MFYRLMFLIDFDTPMWKLEELERLFMEFLDLNPMMFNKSACSMTFRDVEAANGLKIAFNMVGCSGATWHLLVTSTLRLSL